MTSIIIRKTGSHQLGVQKKCFQTIWKWKKLLSSLFRASNTVAAIWRRKNWIPAIWKKNVVLQEQGKRL